MITLPIQPKGFFFKKLPSSWLNEEAQPRFYSLQTK